MQKKFSQCELPDEAMAVVKKEIKRLKKMPQQSPEYPMLRNYLELVSELPWNKSSMEVIDIQKAKEVKSHQSSTDTLRIKFLD